MSNFICKECGMTNIDCGGAGYKTPKEIELEEELNSLKERLKALIKDGRFVEALKVLEE